MGDPCFGSAPRSSLNGRPLNPEQQRCCRLTLTSATEQVTDRRRVVLKHGLSLSEEEIEALPKAIPLELALARASEAQHARLEENLKATGIEASREPLLVNFEPCALHAKLATSGSCELRNASEMSASLTLGGAAERP